jgi:hypothetical protein
VRQIETATETLRSRGQAAWSRIMGRNCPTLGAIRDRLKGQ